MAVLDFSAREVVTKLVYFGAVSSGVCTNVERLASQVASERRSNVIWFGPQSDPSVSLCFEYVREPGVKNFPMRVQVFALPGQLSDPSLRSLILGDVDAIVFVADARASREQANVESLLELERMLAEKELQLAQLPLVLQVNHTDRPDARVPERVVVDLNPYGFPVHAATAHNGDGVGPTHETAMRDLTQRLEQALSGKRSGVHLEATRLQAPIPLESQIAEHVKAYERTAEAQARASDPRNRYAEVPVTDHAVAAYQTTAIRGSRPVAVLDASVDEHEVVLDVIHTRANDQDPRRVRIRLQNRPLEDLLEYGDTHPGFSPDTGPTAGLPDTVDLTGYPPPKNDLPPVVYGVVGVVGGVLVGLLVGVLLFL